MPEQITLGEHEIDVYPQRHAYLTNRFGKFVTAFMEAGEQLSGETFARFLGERAYEALATLIPNLSNRIPEYEFVGYGSQAALDQARERQRTLAAAEHARVVLSRRLAEGNEDGTDLAPEVEAQLRADITALEQAVPDDPYHESFDKSPSFPDIANAFEVAVRVNRFDALKVLGKLVDPTRVRRFIDTQMDEALKSLESTPSMPSLSSPAQSGEPTPTTSGPTSPTWTASGDGRIPDLTPSAAPIEPVAPAS